jgi:hypothetical protein
MEALLERQHLGERSLNKALEREEPTEKHHKSIEGEETQRLGPQVENSQ